MQVHDTKEGLTLINSWRSGSIWLMSTIFHIASGHDWGQARARGSYTVESLEIEGFIHMSTGSQVVATTGRYYQGVSGLVLLEIDPDALDQDALRWELATNGENFPHLYMELPVAAVIGTREWDAAAQALFSESP